jgi:hypothetical protein
MQAVGDQAGKKLANRHKGSCEIPEKTHKNLGKVARKK